MNLNDNKPTPIEDDPEQMVDDPDQAEGAPQKRFFELMLEMRNAALQLVGGSPGVFMITAKAAKARISGGKVRKNGTMGVGTARFRLPGDLANRIKSGEWSLYVLAVPNVAVTAEKAEDVADNDATEKEVE